MCEGLLLVLFWDWTAAHAVENSCKGRRDWRFRSWFWIHLGFWCLPSIFDLNRYFRRKYQLKSEFPPFLLPFAVCQDKESPGWTRLLKRSQERGDERWIMEDEEWSFNTSENWTLWPQTHIQSWNWFCFKSNREAEPCWSKTMTHVQQNSED